MEVELFDRNNKQFIADAALLLADCFPQAYKESGPEETAKCLMEDRVAIMAVDSGHLVGFVGAIPQYGNTGWELHPLAVKELYRFQGIGTMLVSALEKEVAKKGGITIYLGTDDEYGKTSLCNIDLYEDTFIKIENIINIQQHPYEFYQKIGYKIVGVIPDANGFGKPDIWMAKRIAGQSPASIV